MAQLGPAVAEIKVERRTELKRFCVCTTVCLCVHSFQCRATVALHNYAYMHSNSTCALYMHVLYSSNRSRF